MEGLCVSLWPHLQGQQRDSKNRRSKHGLALHLLPYPPSHQLSSCKLVGTRTVPNMQRYTVSRLTTLFNHSPLNHAQYPALCSHAQFTMCHLKRCGFSSHSPVDPSPSPPINTLHRCNQQSLIWMRAGLFSYVLQSLQIWRHHNSMRSMSSTTTVTTD